MKKTLEIVLCILFFVITSTVFAGEKNLAPDSRTSSVELQLLESQRATLNDERQLLEKQADRNFASIENLINRAIWVFGTILTAAVGSFLWLFGRSRKDFEDNIRKQIELEAHRIVENEADSLRQRYRDLKNQVDELSAYKQRPVVWVFSRDEVKAQTELDALRMSGIENIQIVAPAPGESFELGEPDLVILSYDGTEEGIKRLKVIVERLKAETPPVSLLIYTYNPKGEEIRIRDDERAILKGFDWYVPVNFPSQLLAQSQLLLRRNRKSLGDLSRG